MDMDIVLEALKHKYKTDSPGIEASSAADLSRFLMAEETMNSALPLLTQIKIQHADWLLSGTDSYPRLCR
ncbi:MAG: hypothetical protein ACI9CE_001451 [Flavobacterium sp.]|jgi:hypothetical protein